MANNSLRTLLPAAGEPSRSTVLPQNRALVPRQPHVSSACLQCRKSKSKCSGERPQCVRCAARSLTCEYDNELTGVGLAELRRRLRELTARNESFERIVSYLAFRPEGEAQNALRLLRTAENAQQMFELVTNGDLLFQQHVMGFAAEECNDLQEIEDAAIQGSPIKVPARPWTSLVGNGMVSDLISNFMRFDQPFLFSFIDKERLVEDMQASSPREARYCSPFLVNAICSLRSHNSPYVSAFNRLRKGDLRQRFFEEAQEFLNLEQGRVSLPTAQGLAILYMCCAGMGRDRAGRMYRYMAYDMLKRLQLIRAQREQDPMDEEGQKWSKAASRASWGLYCFDSIISYAYAQQSVVGRPTCPRTFLLSRSSRWADGNFDSTLILDAMCDLSIIYNEAMGYHTGVSYRLGSESDLERRSQYLARIRDWRQALTPALHVQNNPAMELFWLRSYEDQVIISIVKDLGPDTTISAANLQVRDISVSCCLRSMEGLNLFTNEFNAGLYSCSIIFWLYCSAVTMLHFLGSPTTDELFTDTCRHLESRSKDFPLTAYILQAVKVLAEQMSIQLPPQTLELFESLSFTPEDFADVPITFVIPDHENVARELGIDENADSGIHLGALLHRMG